MESVFNACSNTLAVVLACGQGTAKDNKRSREVKKIDFILDWTWLTTQGFMLPRKKVISKKLEWMLI